MVMLPALPSPSGSSGDRLLAEMTVPFDSSTLCAVTSIFPPLAFSAEVAIVLALLVTAPEAVIVTLPASPESRTVPLLLLVISEWFASVRLSPVIVMSPARPVLKGASSLPLWLLILEPFVRLTVPPFITTSPPRPPVSLDVLVLIKPLSMINASAVMVTWPEFWAKDRLKICPSAEITTESAVTVTFPAGPVDVALPAAIEAPFVMVTVPALTVISPGAPAKESVMMPVLGPESRTELAMLPGPASPCTVTIPPAAGIGFSLLVLLEMVAPSTTPSCRTLSTMFPP